MIWDLITGIVGFLLWLYLLLLIGRLVFDWVQFFAREWRPRGAVLVLAEVIYSATDPPLRALRRLIPPLTLGQVRLDLAFIILFFAVTIAAQIVSAL
ncbi:YggT family protein [Cellulosimicrobium composti]|uniref:YggT family protein n=1 Tax=Cellulosimicrobium composti TaxID=2672572 RepID=UPI000467C5F1|nr:MULTISPECIES: YggT family protein [Cellulosimicrobium]TWG82315.1 YggT family protein [Cellulosimicrobium cellulans J34]SMF33929.1 YggT family protein [Cellulosimicrobium cellulans J1]